MTSWYHRADRNPGASERGRSALSSPARRLLERVGTRVVVALAVTLILTGLRASGALGATYATSCPTPAGTDPACEALAERLEAVVAAVEGAPDYSTVLGSIDANTGGGGEPSEISGTVALSGDDRDRLDLTWWGQWATVGLMFALMLAPRWFSAFRVTHGG